MLFFHAYSPAIANKSWPEHELKQVIVVNTILKQAVTSGILSQLEPCQRIIDTLPAVIAYIDADRTCRYVNAAFEDWFEQPRRNVIGHPLEQAFSAWYARIEYHIGQGLKGEKVCIETKIRLPKGNRRILVSYTPDPDHDGIVRGLTLMAIDMTGNRLPRRTIPEQDQQLRRITDAIPLFIAQCDTHYRIRFVNHSYAQKLGLRAADTIGKQLSEIVGEEAFAQFRKHVDAVLAGEVQEQEIKIPFKIGEHDMHMTYVPERDERGRIQGLIAAFSDITRLRRTEEQLHRREQEFKTLVENSPDVITRIDRNSRHLYVNPAIEATFGLPASAYLGKTKTEIGLPQVMVDAWDAAAKQVFATGLEQRFEFNLPDHQQHRHFSVRLIPELNPDGSTDSILGITYDVTDRTRMEQEREILLTRERSARIQAETAARARDEFLAIVSHELRAPLNGIQSWAHILENYVAETATTPLAQRAISGIKTGIAQQVRLIEDLLDVTRMVSGKLRLVKQPLAFLPVLQAAVASVRSMASAKQIDIECSYQITAEQINGDGDRVQQIFWNLLTNAIKFTPSQGKVWLTAEPSGSTICVTVKDNGIGISPEFLPQLFDRFSQQDTSSTRGHSGLGLGLFLVHHLVELHGGRITIDSRGAGSGATFSVSLPLAASDQATALLAETQHAALNLPSLSGIRILLIDDEQEARDALTVLLTAAGANVFAVASSAAAIGWLQSLAMNELPDMLVSDIAMPDEDGYTVLRKIRKWKASQDFSPLQRLPALALTAFSQREDRMRALSAGFQMHMSKPVVPEELIVVIANMVQHG